MAAGGGGPHQGRDGSGHPADHNVLRGAGLQQHRVEQHVAAQAQQRQAGRQTVHAPHQQGAGRQGQGHGDGKGGAHRQPPGGQGTTTGAQHAPVELLFPEAIEHPSGGGGEGPASEGAGEAEGRQGPPLRQGHTPKGGGQQQGDQPRLGNLQPGRQPQLGPGGNHLFTAEGRRSSGAHGGSTNHGRSGEGQRKPWRCAPPGQPAPPPAGQRRSDGPR